MKHLKTYSQREFHCNESNTEKLPDDVRHNIHDILLELSDMGYPTGEYEEPNRCVIGGLPGV